MTTQMAERLPQTMVMCGVPFLASGAQSVDGELARRAAAPVAPALHSGSLLLSAHYLRHCLLPRAPVRWIRGRVYHCQDAGLDSVGQIRPGVDHDYKVWINGRRVFLS